MCEKSLISVIVPVYNRERFIERCVKSIVCQTHKNLEIILVDDGSKDNSLSLCNKCAEQDARIKVISQENGGPSKARNTGIEAATGEYIVFVDSDDTVEIDMYEKMLKNIQNSGAQMAFVGMNYCYEDTKRVELIPALDKRLLTKKEFLNLFFNNSLLCFSSVNKMYSRETIGNVRFDTNIKMSEDQKFVYEILKNVNTIIYDPVAKYNVHHNEESLSRAVVSRYHLSQIDVNEYILNDLQDIEIKADAILRNVDVCLSVFVPQYNNGKFELSDKERVDGIILQNKSLILKQGQWKLRIKYILYRISPSLLRFVLLMKDDLR